MEKIKLQTTDIVDENIKRIGELFPNCLTERLNDEGKPEVAIDFDQLRQELSKDIVEGAEERYQFTWPDKRNAIRLANAPTTDTLRPCREESVDFDNTQNLYIEGDNLQVLKLLRENYLGKVKMIYIDPPYNTGNDFVYNDDFSQSAGEYMHNSGQEDEEGNRLVINAESNGRFHTDWLNMIYPRLKVAKDLLSDDGVIFISIDDNEQRNLKNICDEIFGEPNFVAQLIWEQGRKSMATQVAVNHEYCYIYCKNKASNILRDSNVENTNWREKKQGLEAIYAEYDRLKAKFGNDFISIEKGIRLFYKNLPDDNPSKRQAQYKCVDAKGLYFPGDIAQGTGNGGRFNIIHPVTGKPCKLPKGGWRFGEDKLPYLLKENRIHFGEDETKVPCLKRYLKETEYEVVSSVFYKDGRGASKRIEQLFGTKVFDFPKDEEIMKKFISLITSYSESNSIILDFFSGSASTAHAVMQLNAEDGGKRKFIMVQLPEETAEDSEAYKAGYKNICEIGKERIRRAGKMIKDNLDNKDNKNKSCPQLFELSSENRDPDTGFRVLKLDSSNMQDVYYTPAEFNEQKLFDDNIKPDRTEEDLLFQTMIELGIELSAKIEKRSIAGKTVWSVSDGYLMACFDEEVNETTITEIARQHPYYFVMRDSSLANDQVADNFEQIWEEYSKDTVRRIL